ncbi:hypothetical protein PR048_032528 [Dryococelus australis]|uniref:Uncharacterized protein n=1 Tax=Dryococelus australis TaxID=614101 RepID=A0ABQ9G5F6_9NEOP|nr:hypothetical protein PR048_032528 [Dryococelus australis]
MKMRGSPLHPLLSIWSALPRDGAMPLPLRHHQVPQKLHQLGRSDGNGWLQLVCSAHQSVRHVGDLEDAGGKLLLQGHVHSPEDHAQSPALPRSHRVPARACTASHHGNQGLIPGRFAPGFSHVGIALDDAACRRVFLGYSSFPRPCIPAPLHPRASFHVMFRDDGHLWVPAGKPVTLRRWFQKRERPLQCNSRAGEVLVQKDGGEPQDAGPEVRQHPTMHRVQKLGSHVLEEDPTSESQTVQDLGTWQAITLAQHGLSIYLEMWHQGTPQQVHQSAVVHHHTVATFPVESQVEHLRWERYLFPLPSTPDKATDCMQHIAHRVTRIIGCKAASLLSRHICCFIARDAHMSWNLGEHQSAQPRQLLSDHRKEADATVEPD